MPLPYEKEASAGFLGALKNAEIYLKKQIFEEHIAWAIPLTNPVAIIVGGQNASGKSTLGYQFLQSYETAGVGMVKIEGDALREYHPRFDRFVHDHSLKAAYNQMPVTVEKLKAQGHCSCIHLYTRTGVLFEGDYRTADLSGIIARERNRPYTHEEIEEFRAGWRSVAKQMHLRHAGKEEFAEIFRRMDDPICTIPDDIRRTFAITA
jgi:hypothetical protein